MKKIYALVLGLLLLPNLLNAQCSETDEERILLVGDSWAFFMFTDGTINTVLDQWGHSNINFFTNGTLSENGAETDDFLTATKQDEIQAQLDAKPSIDVVHLSIGGNDVLGSWNINFTPAQTDSLKDTVMLRLIAIVDFIKQARPGINIVWSGYCYPNFEEVIEDAAPFQSSHPFYGTWEGMGFPTHDLLNEILNDFSAQVEDYANTDPDIDFISATGLMQYTEGQIAPLGVAPGGTYPAYSVTLPAGDYLYPTPKTAMRDYGIVRDCFHLSQKGYRDLFSYNTQKFYHKFFMRSHFLSEGGAKDGSVNSATTVSNSLLLGENGGEDYATILSFNTDAVTTDAIASASIFIRQETITAGNPFDSTTVLTIVNGNFGASEDVEPADYSFAGDITENVCVFGSTAEDKDWVRIDLPASMLPFINNSGTTQFRIESLSGVTGDMINLTDASDSDFAPVLSVDYVSQADVDEIDAVETKIALYPNPTNNMIYFKSNSKIESVEVFNALGELMISNKTTVDSIDMSSFRTGVYIVRVFAEGKTSTHRVIKK